VVKNTVDPIDVNIPWKSMGSINHLVTSPPSF